MENFKIGLFEILGALIPGIPISVILILLINNHGLDYEFLDILIKRSNSFSIIIFGVISFAVGFAIQYPSYECFKILTELLWKKRIGRHPTSIGKRGKELSYIRHMSPSNYIILNTFMAHRTMSYNLAFSLFISTIFVWILFVYNCNGLNINQIFFITIISLVFAFLFLRRAVSFHEWIQRIITETYSLIKNTAES